MEIIGENKPTVSPGRKGNTSVRGYIGAVLIGFGVVLLLSNFGQLTYLQERYIFSWQMVMVLFGGLMMAARKQLTGTLFLVAGIAAMLIEIFGIELSVWKIIIPALVIMSGVVVLVNSLKR